MNSDHNSRKTIFTVILFLLSFYPAPLWAGSGGLLVATASSMKLVFEELARDFQRHHPGIKVKLSSGSSGNFFSQIKHGAPFDIFFSADMGYPHRLSEEGQSWDENQAIPYAVGHIVLWSPKEKKFDIQKEKSKLLLSKKISKIAIANPKHAPYGRAAVEWLTKAGIYSQVKSRLVLGENISQAAQFAHTGAAQAGVLALSLALDPKMVATGNFWEIPEDQHSPIEQGFLILKNTKNPKAAQSFVDFVVSPAGGRVLRKYGFALP